MRYIPTTYEFVEELKHAAHNMKRSKSLTQSDALRRVAASHGFDHWGHVMWCLKETNNRIANGFRVKANLVDPSKMSLTDEVEYIIRLSEIGEDTLVCLNSFVLFSTIDGDAWLLDVATNDALCLRWRGERQKFSIVEDQKNILVHYDATFSLREDNFDVISDNPAIGRRTILADYPAREIGTFIETARR
jgi:hypothetical protein